MLVKCPQCQAMVEIDEAERFSESPVAICPKCSGVILLETPDDESDEAEVVGGEEAKKEPLADIYGLKEKWKKRYFIWCLVLLALFLGYQYAEGVRRQAGTEEIRLAKVRTAFQRLAAAQENYHLKTGRYTNQLSDLASDFRPNPYIRLRIVHADGKSWAAEARYDKNPETCYGFDTSKGGLREECTPDGS